jgi:hypothetical protein
MLETLVKEINMVKLFENFGSQPLNIIKKIFSIQKISFFS